MEWSNTRILLVHSDIRVRKWAHDIFHKYKVAGVQSTGSAPIGYDLLGRFAADVAVVQLQQNDMNGAEFTRKIRGDAASPNPQLPIVLFVDAPNPELLRTACEAGIEGIVSKSTEPEKFIKRIGDAITAPKRFVASKAYFGPCRRGETPSDFKGPNRREQPLLETRAQEAVEEIERAQLAPRKPAAAGAPVAPRKKAREWDEGELAPKVERPKAREWDPASETTPKKPLHGQGDWADAMAPIEAPPQPEVKGFDIVPVLEEHLLWLQTRGDKGKKASLDKADLNGATLAGAEMTNAGFRDADLSDSDCKGAVFASADMRRAELSGANLTGANLSVANLRAANLRLCQMGEVSLRGADLSGACMTGAVLETTDFAGAIMLDTDIREADLSRAIGLVQVQINKTRADLKTRLPPGLSRPEPRE
ncbi:MAG: response regulator [Rhodospirillales bacterium]|jgi:DNA-binding NarL/FixJ family response regulator|nr:response regulator [Rhodospirillales bacterium]